MYPIVMSVKDLRKWLKRSWNHDACIVGEEMFIVEQGVCSVVTIFYVYEWMMQFWYLNDFIY